MDKTYLPQDVEPRIYRMWEDGNYFTPTVDRTKTPFTILLPLPNANDPMHMGHALFTIQDIMVRYHRMLGQPTLWLPGGDHAGIETQYVFEKHLAKEGKSRFQFDRQTLYDLISAFVEKNKDINRNQMKRLGFSLDWSRYRYSLDPEIVSVVMETFQKLFNDGLAYRAERLVNYCTKCGTAFSDLEINHVEREDLLYTISYGPISIATTRPETIFADSAVAVHPKDKRYTKLIGKMAVIPIVNKEIPIIADERIQPDFGTGALKVTPAHDELDYEIGQNHQLPTHSCIGRDGRLTRVPDRYSGLKVMPAREAAAQELQTSGALRKTEKLIHTVSVCYRCGTTIEPMLIPQWYVKTKTLAEKAISAVRSGRTSIEPLQRFEDMYFEWLEHVHDWNISRQIVWGPRIPVWYCLECNPEIELTFIDTAGTKVQGTAGMILKNHSFEEITQGLQSLIAPLTATPFLEHKEVRCPACKSPNKYVLQETDTFDTWFLSAQWPYSTLGYSDDPKKRSMDFDYFYPTSVLDTLWDILFFWVARMMMLGLYRTGEVPFHVVHIHARIVDRKGQKMSKSKGNVMNPIEMVEKYGADALRMALVFGAAPGSDIALSEDKIRGMRNYANKLWNICRFTVQSIEQYHTNNPSLLPFYDESIHQRVTIAADKQIISQTNMLVSGVTKDIEAYRFSDAAQKLYEFAWHTLADTYLEQNKERFLAGDECGLCVLRHVYLTVLKLLHPFMPFVTEELWSKIPRKHTQPLIISAWPRSESHSNVRKTTGT